MEAQGLSRVAYRDGGGPGSDDELVRRALGGAREAYGALVRRHAQRVYRAVRSVLHEDAEVEDVVQQTFLRTFVTLGQFEGSCTIATWLARIAVNEALMRLRRRRTGAGEAEDHAVGADDEASSDPGPERQAAARESLDRVARAVRRLPERQRELFRLRHVEGLSIAQAAARMGITECAAKIRLYRTRGVLRGIAEGLGVP